MFVIVASGQLVGGLKELARFLNALEQAKWHIVSLYGVILLLVFVCLCLILGWHVTQTHLRINIPPQIPDDGITLNVQEVPKATIYSFAFYIWQSINYWPNNGFSDYKKSITDFSAYVTPEFLIFLKNDYSHRLSNGEIQARLRTMQGINGTSYNADNVKYIGHNTWLVHLPMRLTERMDNTGNPVKDAQIDYSLRVVRYNVNSDKNKWGLALDGFFADPKRIKTII